MDKTADNPSALVVALYALWPLNELDTLLRGGAKPNALSQGMTGLTALMHRLCPSTVQDRV